ncbi:MAG: discoidin domain-containing protein [Methylococcales bacterium]|nr:discoidin domain-containing protein [Methylococcales bacterium]
MTPHSLLKTSLFIITSLGLITPPLSADPVTLSKELKLHVPVIHFQNQEQLQYIWADFEYQNTKDNAIGFTVSDYGVLSENDIPPSLSNLTLVTEGAAPSIVDITATDARLTFVSSIPLACSVVYGKTLDFGKIAIDPSMNGGVIIDHNPILSKLEENTLYYYRVQGTDATGKIYWSPAATFKTTGRTITDNNLLSLNNGATITAVSSNFSGAANNETWGANSAIDGSNSTAWSSNNDGDNAFIEITLAESKQIETIEVFSRSMGDDTAKILTFTITTDSGEVLSFNLPNTTQAHQFPLNRQTSSIRLDVVSSTGGNTGLIEIKAYEVSPSRTSEM